MKTTTVVNTLKITSNVNEAYSMLKENAGYFGDNGGDSDGGLHLPFAPLDSNDSGVDDVVKAGYGKIVKAAYYCKEEIADLMKMFRSPSPAAVAEQNGNDPESPEWSDYCASLDSCDGVYGYAGYSSQNVFAVILRK